MSPRTLLVALLALSFPATASAATYVVEPGQKIQDAVAKAADGDTVEVRSGTYTEQVSADDAITIAASPGTLLVSPADKTGPTLSLADGGTVTGLGVISFVGDAVSVGPGATLIQRSAFITGAKDAAALTTIGTDGQGARTITIDSTVLSGAAALSATMPQSLGASPPGKIAVDARHVTAIGRIVANSSAASPGAGGIAITFLDSIIRGKREAAGRAATLILPAVPATITADPARNSVADDASDASSVFVRPSRADYHLRADASALMNKGSMTQGESDRDIDGQPRVAGSASDYGADEFTDRAPTVSLTAPATVRQGREATFTASAADPDAAIGGGIVRYVWNFGDGSAPVETTTPSATHAFAERRSYTVTVTVTDRNGSTAASTPATITVLDGTPPSVTIDQPAAKQRVKLYKAKGARRRVVFFGSVGDDTAVGSVVLVLRRSASKNGTCRWFDGRSRLRAASCASPTLLTARIDNGTWRYVLPRKARLRRGTYQVSAVSTDASGLGSAVVTNSFRFR